MHRPLLLWRALVVAVAVALAPRPASAYDQYGRGCDTCHDFFAGRPDLHDIHRNQILNTTSADRCQLCHMQARGSEGPPVNTYRSRGRLPGPAPSNLGCAGCHGNDYGLISSTDGLPKASGRGLRRHHEGIGVTVCATCHAGEDAGPVLGENVPPPYYARTEVRPKDPCNADDSEGPYLTPLGRGLDNDGDLVYDTADPDCVAPPTGACCTGLVCSVTDATTCTAGGGTYGGDATPCAAGTCAPPTGACCTGPVCAVLDAASCTAGGGTYQGDAMPCVAATCSACTSTPGVIRLLLGVKDRLARDAVFSWQLDPASGAYRVYSVSRRLDLAPPPLGGGPPRGTNPAATLRCSTPDGLTLTCTHAGACAPAVGTTLFYQVVGVCRGGASEEGPN